MTIKSNMEDATAKAPMQDKKQKKSIFKKILYALIVLIIFIVIVQVVVADKYSAQVLVIGGDKKVGVNPTEESLDFGDLSADTSATRYIKLNAGGISTFIYVIKFGSIAELIDLNENGFTINKGEEKRLELSLYMPSSAPVGDKYTGKVWIFKVPKIW